MTDKYPAISPIGPGLSGRCPRCGEGHVFRGFLKVAPRCEVCDLDLAFADSADGPAVFIILIVGFIVVAAVLVTEVKYQPPIWLHLILWLPLTLILSIGMLRPLKGLTIALQYANKAEQGRLDDRS